MPQEVPPLSESQRAVIAETLRAWAEKHPFPNLPLIELADGSELTPRDMAIAITEPQSRIGSLLYRVFAVGLIPDEVEPPETLEDILADFRRDAEFWISTEPR